MKDYDMSVLYHLDNAIVVVDALSRMTMGSVIHLDETKKDLSREVHRFSRENSPDRSLYFIITLSHL